MVDADLMPRPSAVPSLRCRRNRADGHVRVAAAGELDLATVGMLDEAIRRAWATSDLILLDLSGLRFVDSTGMRLIADASLRIRRAGGRLVITRGPVLDRLVTLLDLWGALDVADSPKLVREPTLASLHL